MAHTLTEMRDGFDAASDTARDQIGPQLASVLVELERLIRTREEAALFLRAFVNSSVAGDEWVSFSDGLDNMDYDAATCGDIRHIYGSKRPVPAALASQQVAA